MNHDAPAKSTLADWTTATSAKIPMLSDCSEEGCVERAGGHLLSPVNAHGRKLFDAHVDLSGVWWVTVGRRRFDIGGRPGPLDVRSLIIRAARVAHQAHAGQTRNCTGLPYIVHPDAVAGILMRHGCAGSTVAAGYLHDVVEDTDLTLADLHLLKFPDRTVGLVDDMTDRFTKEAYPHEGRPWRRSHESKRIAGVARDDFHTLKAADLVANTSDISYLDPKFAGTYLPECARTTRGLLRADPVLLNELYRVLAVACSFVGLDVDELMDEVSGS